ncbi:MAG: hypothetical protein A4S08_06395 [Proteobacteria bacterium SG_bin4]|nr:MAG: hypothetical protein A4S08_06395 [Proteobacteria bacterium SG_bin4]
MMELLQQHFDTAFAAPDGIKKLRELILTLAMQGKLVAQDPNDPPASELLKQIEAEKQRLHASPSSPRRRGSSQSKPLPPIRPEEMPYELPQGWEWVRINEICHDWGQKIPNAKFTYIDVGAIDNKLGTISPSTQILDATDAPSRARKIVKQGTVIYSTVRPYLLNIAILENEYDPEPIASTAFAVLHPFASVSARFIYHYLRSPIFIRYVENTQKGVAYPAINDGDFFNGLFPLSPLPEQHRIVAKIDQLMAKCNELEALRKAREEKRRTVHAAAIKQLLDTTSSFPQACPRADGEQESSSSKESDLRSPSTREQTYRGDGVSAHGWNFIQQHFDELYTVKENVAELRKTILQLAVMGCLVPQDPNDPPVSELLKQIEAEKQRLHASSSPRRRGSSGLKDLDSRFRGNDGIKTKSLPPIKPEEVPYELPKGWEWVSLEDVSEKIHYGYTASADHSNQKVRLLRITDIQDNKVDWETVPGCNARKEEVAQYLLADNDILIARTGGTVGKSFLVKGINVDAVFASYLIRVVPSIHMDVRYIKYFAEGPLYWRQLYAACSGTGQPNVNGTSLSQLLLALPPLPEQHRIVAKIDQLMALCDRLEQQIDAATGKQTELLNAVMAAV